MCILASYVLRNWIYNAIWNWIVWGYWYQTLGCLFVCFYNVWRILSFWSVLFCCSVLSIILIFLFNNIWFCCCMLVWGYWYQCKFVYFASCLLQFSSRVWFGLISEVTFFLVIGLGGFLVFILCLFTGFIEFWLLIRWNLWVCLWFIHDISMELNSLVFRICCRFFKSKKSLWPCCGDEIFGG
jgi:hypothetical protein